MEQAGKARGAAVGSKTQARRKALQDPETRRPVVHVTERRDEALQLNETGQALALGELNSDVKPASQHGLVNRLGPAAGVELKEAQAGLASVVLPEDLAAMRPLMDAQSWNRVLEERAMRLVQEETLERRSQMPAYHRGPHEFTGGAVGAEQQIKQRVNDLGLVGDVAPQVEEKGIWAELDNLRWRVLRAHQTAEELRERLAGVLLPTEEKEKEASATPAQRPLSRSSAEVALVAQSVLAVETLLVGLLARLDL